MEYIVNVDNARLHKLPASESCNTDQIEYGEKFVGEEPLLITRHYYGGFYLFPVVKCKRCFRAD